MKIRATKNFLRRSHKLLKRDPQLKKHLRRTLEKLQENPFNPELKTHKLSGSLKEFWSCSVTYQIRIRFKIVDDIIELIDTGKHDEVY